MTSAQPMRKRVVTFWAHGALPRLRRLCVASWLEQGYEVGVYSFEETLGNMPPGAEVLPSEPLVPRSRMLYRGTGGRPEYAKFADIVRMALLARGEGIWADTDYLMIRPFPEATDLLAARDKDDFPCNAVLWLPPDSPIPHRILEAFNRPDRLPEWTYFKPRVKKLAARVKGEAFTFDHLPHNHWGRHALIYYFKKHRLLDRLLPADAFFAPETYSGALLRAEPFERFLTDPGIYGAHFFDKGTDENAAPIAGSFHAWAEDKLRARL
ncbi:MAG: hypothetical protein AAFR16_01710 [Pseudomonadota bacterium]